MKKKILYLALIPALMLSACKKDNDDDDMMEEMYNLNLSINNLMPSASGEQYEGWIIVDGQPVSTGTFMVEEDGSLSKSTFMIDETQLWAASDFVISIEPIPDNDPAPSNIKVLGGSFASDMASISPAHPAVLGNDFMTIDGNYILATPTTSTMDDELSGVWFLEISNGTPMEGLMLPALSSSWKYEGWVVIDGMPLTTGTFTMADEADDSAPYSSSENSAPPFPGEDLVMNAPSGKSFPINLTGKTVVISIEPNPDNSPDPFMFKPLAGNIPNDATDHTNYSLMSNVNASFPSGYAQRK